MLSVGSVCSGAGGFDLGFRQAGYRTAWLCEFDPWRQRLLAKNFPGVPCHPDLEHLDPDQLEPIDVLIGGTPCQDLSVAGRRAGLNGDRSSLFWHYMRVRNHLGVEWCVWENVAGALSSNDGLDFASVLGAFVGADVPVPAAGWGGAGVVAGPWGGACWRTLDAQHFGVPQRRRRVFVVGRLGGPCPPEVLLEQQSGSGNPAARGGEGARVAAPLTRGSSRPGVSEPGRRKEDDYNLVARTLRAEGFDASEDGTGRGTPLTVTDPHLLQHGEPRERGQREHRPDVEGGQRPGDSVAAGDAAGVDGASVDADGVRAADGLAGRMDMAAVRIYQDSQYGVAEYDDAGSLRAGRIPEHQMVVGAIPSADRCALDPQPDGRRYAACGDGVVAPVAEWIARRLHTVAKRGKDSR